jgi:medium-chain acyl-[acyl-carrier-protein] hydrolase
MRLFCFPYAGGSASIYRTWQESFPSTIEVCSVELPGRGKRLAEKPFSNLAKLVEVAAQALLPFFDVPFAFFGHSMGALIGYELAQLIRSEREIAPRNLFVSGHGAPHLPGTHVTYNLPEDEFIVQLRHLNGTPEEVLEHPELMKLLIPLLRADFEVVETYVAAQYQPLECPITCFGGINDTEVPRENLEAWSEHTTMAFSLHMFPGDHFFLHAAQAHLIRIIVQGLIR